MWIISKFLFQVATFTIGFTLLTHYKRYRTLSDSRLIATKSVSPIPTPNFMFFNPIQSIDQIVLSSGTLSRRHSLPNLGTAHLKDISISISRKRSSLPPLPTQPVLRPTRLPSISDPPISAWRLSFTSENRGKLLRKLSTSRPEPTKLGTFLPGVPPPFEVDGRPTRHWLHSQGLRSSSQALTISDPNDSLTPDALERDRTPTQEFGGVDGSGDDGTAVSVQHLHEMRISQRLASHGGGLQSSSESPDVGWENRYVRDGEGGSGGGDGGGGGMELAVREERNVHMRYTSESVALSERIRELPLVWGKVVGEEGSGGSSFYPEGGNSIQASPEGSRFDLLAGLRRERKGLDEIVGPDGTFFTYSAYFLFYFWL